MVGGGCGRRYFCCVCCSVVAAAAIFNVADASITVGVATLIIGQRSFFPKNKKPNPESEEVLEDKA